MSPWARRQLALEVSARLNVGKHQTCMALIADSITGETLDNDLGITISFGLGLGGSALDRRREPS